MSRLSRPLARRACGGCVGHWLCCAALCHAAGERCLALPKLNLQFLTLHDYLLRTFNLFRCGAGWVVGRWGAAAFIPLAVADLWSQSHMKERP